MSLSGKHVVLVALATFALFAGYSIGNTIYARVKR